MRQQDIVHFWERIADEPDPAEAERKIQLHYLSVLVAIANGRADPDPETLAREVMRQVARRPVPPDEAAEIRFINAVATAGGEGETSLG